MDADTGDLVVRRVRPESVGQLAVSLEPRTPNKCDSGTGDGEPAETAEQEEANFVVGSR